MFDPPDPIVRNVCALAFAFSVVIGVLSVCDVIIATARDSQHQREARDAQAEMKAAQTLAIAIGEKCKVLEASLRRCEEGRR